MSGFISEPERSHEQLENAETNYGGSEGSKGQNVEKMAEGSPRGSAVTLDERYGQSIDTEISVGQRMLSAVSGSLFTSLLGISTLRSRPGRSTDMYHRLVTPLDVVRVRLQSQPSIPRPHSLPSIRHTSKFTNLPQNLGITACCREVFWVNNNSQFCMAAPDTASSSTTIPALHRVLPSSGIDPAADCAVDVSRQKTFTSTLDALRKIARNEGTASLWRGLSPTLVMSIPANVIYFTGYDWLRSNPHSVIQKYIPDDYAPLIAGSVARVAAATAISPVEMFRTRMQANTGGNAGVYARTLGGLRTMVQSEGYRSLWRGFTLTMWRDVPFSGIYWWGYEAVRNKLAGLREAAQVNSGRPRSKTRDGNHTNTFVDSFIAGATSGAFASVVTTPFDVGKTRQQVLERSKCEEGKSILRPEEQSMPRFLHSIWKEEGIGGLFKGWAARCLKVAPACAIMISSYEVGKKIARRMNERRRDLSAHG